MPTVRGLNLSLALNLMQLANPNLGNLPREILVSLWQLSWMALFIRRLSYATVFRERVLLKGILRMMKSMNSSPSCGQEASLQTLNSKWRPWLDQAWEEIRLIEDCWQAL